MLVVFVTVAWCGDAPSLLLPLRAVHGRGVVEARYPVQLRRSHHRAHGHGREGMGVSFCFVEGSSIVYLPVVI